MALIDGEKVQVEAGEEANAAKWFDSSLKIIKEEVEKKEDVCKRYITYQLTLFCEETTLNATILKINEVTTAYSKVDYKIVDSYGIAFDHAKIITVAVERLRGKVEYTDIALNLMPSYFTLTELQKVYEIILDNKLLTANFRRKIKHLVKETNQYTEGAGHRPPKLFVRNI